MSKAPSKRTKSSASPSMKQSTLLFPKRTSSGTNVFNKGTKIAVSRTKFAPSPVESAESIDSSSDSSGTGIFNSEEPIEIFSDEEVPAPVSPRTSVTTRSKASASQTAEKGKAPLISKGNVGGKQIDLAGGNLGKWSKHYAVVREKMGYLPPIHAEGQSKVDHILRVFDTSPAYGPCSSITRLDRWQRAQDMGLNPPQVVYEILTTTQGLEEDKYKHDVFYHLV